MIAYLTQTLDDVPEEDRWLSPAERERLARLRVPKRREDWRLGRWTAKNALEAAAPGQSPVPMALAAPDRTSADVFARLRRWEIRPAADGAPEAFLDGCASPHVVSISHSGGRGMCAVAPAGVALGCDVERIEPRSDEFLADYFTAGELAYVREFDGRERDVTATLVWSAKESALKALREGLRLDTRAVEARIAIEDGGASWWRRLTVVGEMGVGEFAGWWGRDEEFIYTIVLRACFESERGSDAMVLSPEGTIEHVRDMRGT